MRRFYLLIAALCILIVLPVISRAEESSRRSYKDVYVDHKKIEKEMREAERKLQQAQVKLDAKRWYTPVPGNRHFYFGDHNWIISDGVLDDFHIEVEDEVVYIESDFSEDLVTITPDRELMVNNRRVDLSPKQQQLVTEFYDGLMELDAEVDIVAEGAYGISMRGAEIGLAAAARALERMSYKFDLDDADLDDLEELEEIEEQIEAEIEAHEAELEKESETLEVRAEKLENRGERLEELFEDMLIEIPDLERLDW